MTIIIEKELANLIPPLEDDELKRLTDSLLLEGCRDPLVLWKNTLLDGHNRYAICNKYNIPFKTTKVKIANLIEAKLWIINNQLARRNLTPAKMKYFRGKRYEIEKLDIGKPANGTKIVPLRTRKILAEEYGVSEQTIMNDADFARSVDRIHEEVGGYAKQKILRGDLTQKDVFRISRSPTIERTWKAVLGSEGVEWWTPKKYIDAVHEVMGGIDLDPSSCAEANKMVRAQKFYTKIDDGLKKPWFGRVFLNPPYGNLGASFAQKLYGTIDSSVDEAIMLVNSRATDADWFQPCFEGLICFTDHRIDFNSPDEKETSSTHGSCFVYFGPNEDKFAKEFGEFGNVVKRWP